MTQFTSLANPPFPSHSPPLSLAKLNSKQGHKVILSPFRIWTEHSFHDSWISGNLYFLKISYELRDAIKKTMRVRTNQFQIWAHLGPFSSLKTEKSAFFLEFFCDKSLKVHPPFFEVCHSFLKVQKHDSNLTPSHLFAWCHSFYRFIFLKASLINLIFSKLDIS